MSHPLWQRIAADAGIVLTRAQLTKLDTYLDALIDWNGRLNLTRITDRPDAEVRHIADALTLLRFLPKPKTRATTSLADVGTGGGVPGVPLAIARPDLVVTLVDSTKKKVDAIAAMVATVGIENASVLHTRAEAIQRTFDVVTARAVAEMDTLLGWCDRLMHRHAVLLAMKGPRAAAEIEAIPMKRRKHFHLRTTPIDVPELPGHVVVQVTRVNA